MGTMGPMGPTPVCASKKYYLRAAPPAAGPLTSKRSGKREGEKDGGTNETGKEVGSLKKGKRGGEAQIDEKPVPNRAKSNLELSQMRHGWGPGLQDRFSIDFGSQHDAKLGPSWAKLGPSWLQNRRLRGPRGALGGTQTSKIDF